jgi:hypothetical protein
MKSSVKFVQFTEYGKWNDAENTTALGFMRYYLSSRAEALKESIGKVTAEKPPAHTTGTTASTTGTSATMQSTTVTSQDMPNAAVPGGCGGAKVDSPVLLCGGAIAVMLGAAGARAASKKKKDE